jgi:hypothetical protein
MVDDPLYDQCEYDPAVFIPLPPCKWYEHRRTCTVPNCQICSHIVQKELEHEFDLDLYIDVPDDTPEGYDPPADVSCPQCGGTGFLGDGQGGFGPTFQRVRGGTSRS